MKYPLADMAKVTAMKTDSFGDCHWFLRNNDGSWRHKDVPEFSVPIECLVLMDATFFFPSGAEW